MKIIDQFICGDALAELRELPAMSIDMCMTSPPYYGLRDYGNKQIFGGDKKCEHRWGINPVEHDALRYRGHNANVGSNKNPEIHQGKEKSGGQDCIYCGAWKGQLGLEPTPELYIEHLTEIFNEVKRVLKKEGTLWLNIGDTYGGDSPVRKSGAEQYDPQKQSVLKRSAGGTRREASEKEIGIKPKCLCMIPERLAWSLIQNGWILRNKNIWYKRNSMPSSVKDRFNNTYEFVYMFSKSSMPVYWTNKKTLKLVTKQPAGIKGIEEVDWKWERCPRCEGCGEITKEAEEGPKKCSRCNGSGEIKMSFWAAHDYYFDLDAVREAHSRDWSNEKACGALRPNGEYTIQTGQPTGHKRQSEPPVYNPDGKNPGDVFEINTQPFPEAHFAVFPEKLCEKPIKAGCPGEVCKKCGKARERIVEREVEFTSGSGKAGNPPKGKHEHSVQSKSGSYDIRMGPQVSTKTIGWTSCNCKAGFEPGIVLDPFSGAGTVGVVAKSLGRRFILIDIKEEYIKMAERRVAQVGHQKELFK